MIKVKWWCHYFFTFFILSQLQCDKREALIFIGAMDKFLVGMCVSLVVLHVLFLLSLHLFLLLPMLLHESRRQQN